MRGRFITVEGIEGAGKTTQLAYVQALLEQAGQQSLVTREPGGTELGEELRGLLLQHRAGGIGPEAELLLMFAARAEHLAQRIRPALEQGRWVLCDRFTDASYAYQGGGRGMSPERIRVLEQWVQGGLTPDLTLLLDLPVTLGVRRARGRGRPDRFESEQQAFFERVRAAYLERARQHSERVRIIDASGELPEVQSQIRRELNAWLGRPDHAGAGEI